MKKERLGWKEGTEGWEAASAGWPGRPQREGDKEPGLRGGWEIARQCGEHPQLKAQHREARGGLALPEEQSR